MMLKRSPVPRRYDDSGQALAEFALLVPLLLLFLFGTIQFGFTLSGQIGLTNAAREAARYAATVPNTTTAAVLTELTARQMPKAIPGFRNVPAAYAGSSVSYCATPNPNNTSAYPSYSIRVRVNAVYRHPLLIPFVGVLVDAIDGTADDALTARVTEEMRVENPRLTSAGGLPSC
jgi:Flp pilus assembly protein TadG